MWPRYLGKSNDVWIETAERLGEQAIASVLSKAGVGPQQIDSLFFVSVTGVSSPSIDARLVNRMQLSPDQEKPHFWAGMRGRRSGPGAGR